MGRTDSLSRIRGGIHPPADDLPGRAMGQTIGDRAFGLAETHFGTTEGSEVVFSAGFEGAAPE